MERITIPLPVWAIMRILGIEDRYREDLRRWSDSSNASLGGKLSAERWLEVERDILEFQQVICGILDERRADPQDDLLSRIVATEEGEVPLTNQELVWLVRETIVAGNETTIRALADILVNIDDMRAEQPDIWDRLRDDEAFRRGVVEEGIRLASPVMGLWRVTTCNAELGGVTIPKGSTLFLAYSPRIATTPSSPIPTSSTRCGRTSGTTWRSATASTCAWGHRSRGSKHRRSACAGRERHRSRGGRPRCAPVRPELRPAWTHRPAGPRAPSRR